MKEGQKITFDGEADERPGVLPGNIIFVLQQKKHPVFERDGNNLIMVKTIDLVSALTGVEFKVTTLDKRTLLVKSKEGEVIKPSKFIVEY